MDTLSKTRRSWNMSRIRGRDTAPERAVRSLLYRMGFRFRLHVRTLPGRPDVVLSRYRTVVFIHGCFWHRHNACRLAYTPKTRTQFWLDKLNGNVARDRAISKKLRSQGWQVVVVWECELRNMDRLTRRLTAEMEKQVHHVSVPNY
jgi:DNA mismatch endonuclease, patch repair protein